MAEVIEVEVDIDEPNNETLTRDWIHTSQTGEPYNFTGFEARMAVQAVGASEPAKVYSTEEGHITLDEDGFHLRVNPTDLPEPGSYKYDIVVYNGDMFDNIQRGKFKLRAGVTQWPNQ